MHKFTFLFVFVFFFSIGIKAQHVSFETSEGFTLGDINGQNNWETTNGDGGTLANQVITDELASDGSYSLKLEKDPNYPGFPVAGFATTFNYETPISHESASFSADFFMSEQGFTSKSFLIGLVDLEELKYRTYINFAYNGSIDVLVKGDTPGMILNADTGATWEINTWYNVKIETDGSTVRFFLNNEEIYSNYLITDGPIGQIRFAHDNYEGAIYVDNIITTENSMSTNDEISNSFTHHFNRNSNQLILNAKHISLSNLNIYNSLGQSVWNQSLKGNQEAVDLSSLEKGVYFVKVQFGKEIKSFKIIK